MFTVIVFLIAIALAFLVFKRQLSKLPKDDKPVKPLVYGIGTFLITMLIYTVQPITVKVIEAGNVGIKVSLLGDDRGVGKYEYISGVVLYNSWMSRVQEISLTQQHVEYEKLQAVTYGGLPVDISPKFNYSVKAGSAGDMYVNLRKPLEKIEQEWLATSVLAAVNDISNKWKVDSILTHREAFEADILRDANKKVGKWFTLSQLRTNLVPPGSLVNSIQEKTKAAQDVQVAEQRKLVAIAEGITKRETAKADSAFAVISAAGEAKANQLRQSALTPLLIQQQLIAAWSKNGSPVPQVIMGGNSNPMFNMADLLKK